MKKSKKTVPAHGNGNYRFNQNTPVKDAKEIAGKCLDCVRKQEGLNLSKLTPETMPDKA